MDSVFSLMNSLFSGSFFIGITFKNFLSRHIFILCIFINMYKYVTVLCFVQKASWYIQTDTKTFKNLCNVVIERSKRNL